MNSRSATPLFRQAILALVVGCALTACGGGGADGSSNQSSNGAGRSPSAQGHATGNPSGGGNLASSQSSPRAGQSGTGNQPGTGSLNIWDNPDLRTWQTSPQRLDSDDDVFVHTHQTLREQNETEADTAPDMRIPFEGTYTSTDGVRMRISEWIRHAHTNCPIAERLTDDPAGAAPARFQCLAGTYEGIDVLSLAPCSVTLTADGTVVHRNGSTTLAPFRILPETLQYNHVSVYGKPLLMVNNYAARYSFGQFMDLTYMDGQLPSPKNGASRYEYATIAQENYDPANGPVMDRSCSLSARLY